MTAPTPAPQPAAPFDPTNQLLAEIPATLTCAPIGTPNGPRIAHTIRTPAGTHTVVLTRDAALEWARVLRTTAEGVSPLIIPTGPLPPPNGAGR